MITIDLTQTKELIEMFAGEDVELSVDYFEDGHAGPGLYAWHTDYPDEGSILLGSPDVPTRPQGAPATNPGDDDG